MYSKVPILTSTLKISLLDKAQPMWLVFVEIHNLNAKSLQELIAPFFFIKKHVLSIKLFSSVKILKKLLLSYVTF